MALAPSATSTRPPVKGQPQNPPPGSEPALVKPTQRQTPNTQKVLGVVRQPAPTPRKTFAQAITTPAFLPAGATGRSQGPGTNWLVQTGKPFNPADQYQQASLAREPQRGAAAAPSLSAGQQQARARLQQAEQASPALKAALQPGGPQTAHPTGTLAGAAKTVGEAIYHRAQGSNYQKWLAYRSAYMAAHGGKEPPMSQAPVNAGVVAGPGVVSQTIAGLANSANYSPAGTYSLLTHPVGTLRQVGSAIENAATSPLEHPADAALLGWALLSGSGATLARLAGARSALAEGAGIRAAVTRPGFEGGSLLHSPEPGAYTLTAAGEAPRPAASPFNAPKGARGVLQYEQAAGPTPALQVQVPLSRNAIVREAPVVGQKARLARVQAKLDAGTPATPQTRIGRVVQNNLSAQARFGKQLRAQRRTGQALAQAPLTEQQRALGVLKSKLTRGEHAALNVVAVEGKHAIENPSEAVGRHIQTHLDLAEKGVNTQENMAYVRDLKLAGQALQQPRPEFLNAVEKTKALSDATEQKLIRLGVITGDQAANRKAAIASVYRGAGPTAKTEAEAQIGLVRQNAEHDIRAAEGRMAAANREAEKASRQRAMMYERAGRAKPLGRQIASIRQGANLNGAISQEARATVAGTNTAAEAASAQRAAASQRVAKLERQVARLNERTQFGLVKHAEGSMTAGLAQRRVVALNTAKKQLGEARGELRSLQRRGTEIAARQQAQTPLARAIAADSKASRLQREYDRAVAAQSQYGQAVQRGRAAAEQQAQHQADIEAARAKLDARVDALTPHPLEQPPEGAFFFPLSDKYREGFTTQNPGVKFKGTQPGPLGVNAPSPAAAGLGPLSKRFTGRSVEHGLQLNTARNVAYRFGRAVRLEEASSFYNQLFHVGSNVRRSMDEIPLVADAQARAELRRTLAKIGEHVAEASPDEKLALSKEELDTLARLREDKSVGRNVKVGESVDGVVWVPKQFLQDMGESSVRGPIERLADAINNPARSMALYLRPAYALNLAGNWGMQAITQGHLAPMATRQAFRAMAEDGEANVAKIDAGMGNSRSRSYSVPTGMGHQFNERLGEAWNAITDLHSRRSAFYHEAYKAGFRTPEQRNALLNDPKFAAKRIEVFRRANKNMVDYDSLTPIERNTIRRIIYFYPWMSRATIWTLRTLVEHPGKSFALGELGRVGYENVHKQVGKLPPWADRIGYIPVPNGFAKALGLTVKPGQVPLINPTSINTPSTAVQAIQGVAGTAKGVIGIGKGGGIQNAVTPAAQVFASQAGASQGSQAPGLLGTIQSLPQVQALKRLGVIPQNKVTKAILGPPSKTFPNTGVAEALEPLGGGGFIPRAADQGQLTKQAIKAEPRLQRAADNVGLAQQKLHAAAKTAGVALPPQVDEAYKIEQQRQVAYAKLGAKPTQQQKLQADLDLSVKIGRLTKQQADQIRAATATLPDTAVSKVRSELAAAVFQTRVIGEFKRYVTARGGHHK